MIVNVNGAAQLQAALKTVAAGDTIKLAAGDYGSVTIANKSFTGPVTIMSADASKPAVFDYLMLNNVSNLTVKGIEVGIDSGRAVEVFRSDHITLDDLNVHGDTSLPPNAGGGIYVTQSDYVTVANSDLHHLSNGLSHTDSTHLKFTNNDFRDIRIDGIRGGGSSYVEITNNHFTNFYMQDGDHSDAIQFWTTGTTAAAHDILVQGNVFERGAGKVAQGVFFRDESGKMPFENVVIKGNAVVGGMYNGISVIGGKNVTIADNLVAGQTDMKSWIRVEDATGVKLTGNITSAVYLPNGDAGVVQTGTKIIPLVDGGSSKLISTWQTTHDVPTVSALKSVAPVADLFVKAPVAITATATTLTTTNPTAITGDTGNNKLVGTAGNDILDGKSGLDTMTGGAGNDTYVVDNMRDQVVEGVNGGIDTVRVSYTTYTLSDNVENLIQTGTGIQRSVGNGLDNTMVGNGVSSTMDGGSGNDTLVGTGGQVEMTGGAGLDTFRFEAIGKSAQITDFHKDEDVLDLRALLSKYTGVNPVADKIVEFRAEAGGTTVYVDLDGPTGAGGFTQVVKLLGVTGSLSAGVDWIF